MKSFPSTELKQKLGDVLAAADREPVAITRHSKARYVLMDVETFEKRFAQDPRRSFAIEEMPPEHMAMLDEAIAKLEQDNRGD